MRVGGERTDPQGGPEARPLRLAHVIHALAPESGGPSVTVPALCTALGTLGHDVRLHATSHGAPTRVSPQRFALQIHRALPLGGKLGLSPSMHRALVRNAARSELMHSHGLWLWTNLDAHRTSALLRVPHVVSPRGMLEPYALRRNRVFKRLVWGVMQGRAVRSASCIHVTSEAERSSARELGLTNPIAVIPNGVSIPALEAGPAARSPGRTLLFLGRLDHKKGVDLLLRAWSVLAPAFPEWTVDIVGPASGRYASEMQALAEKLRIPRLSFRGPLFGDARDHAFASADLFVLPTRSENFGMAVAEALAAGVPVVCSRGAPWSELPHRGCGSWVDIGVDPLVDGLRQALTLDTATLRAMGLRGRAWMQQEFSWDAQARKMADTYSWLLGRGARPAHVDVA